MADIEIIIENKPPAQINVGAGLTINGLTVGTVETGAPGTEVVATITGAAPNQMLNLTIPRGDTGAKGDEGEIGPVGPSVPDDGSVTAAKLAPDSVHGQTEKASLVSADELLIWDSADSLLKRITKANASSSILPVGTVTQTVYAEYTTHASLSAAIPLDDTIPQNTEGTQILTASITPRSSSNKILARFQCMGGRSTDNVIISSALFNNSTADAISATAILSGGSITQFGLEFLHSPASTSAQTYAIRVGTSGGPIAINGSTNPLARLFGGASRATLTLHEIKG